MAARFFDTSALIRRYDLAEPGSQRVQEACEPGQGHLLLVARLLCTEVASALNSKLRTGRLAEPQRDALWQLFMWDVRAQYQLVRLEEPAHHRAEQLLFKHPLKAADALHLAAALLVQQSLPSGRLEFWTADHQQAEAAKREGLAVQIVA